jgi:hypothetical protein
LQNQSNSIIFYNVMENFIKMPLNLQKLNSYVYGKSIEICLLCIHYYILEFSIVRTSFYICFTIQVE